MTGESSAPGCGLPSRPGPPTALVAAITAAVVSIHRNAAIAAVAVAVARPTSDRATRPWRFSGRWWTPPAAWGRGRRWGG